MSNGPLPASQCNLGLNSADQPRKSPVSMMTKQLTARCGLSGEENNFGVGFLAFRRSHCLELDVALSITSCQKKAKDHTEETCSLHE